ncbi:MAG: hypothetical protein REI45_03295 [Propionicimonas sp.]|nr:hypothetical protein [Propionicimonas sp.]
MTSEHPRRSARGFWLLAVTACLTLAVVAVGLAVVGAGRGPVLTRASIAVDRAVAAAGERLQLSGRQPLAEVTPDQVEVIPAAPFTVETRDATVVVTFTRPLAYATDYTVSIHEVRSRHTGIAVEWSHSFTTPGYAVYSLVSRGPWAFGTDDQVLRTDPAGGDPVTVLSGTGIEAFTVVAGMIIAVSRTSDLESRLVGSAGPGADLLTLETPEGTDIGLLQGSAEQGLVGYTLTGQQTDGDRFYDNALFLQDIADVSASPREVTAADGSPVRVTDWGFIPGARSLVLQDDAGQVFLTGIEAGSALTPLGSHDRLLGFLPGTTTLVVLDGTDEAMLDLASGATTILPPPGDAGRTDVLAGKRTMISPTEWVQQFDDVTLLEDAAAITSRLTHSSPGATEVTVATVPPSLGRLLDTGVSGNGRYAWAEILSPGAPAEDLTSGATDNSVTVLIDLSSGQSLVAVPGAEPLWVTG